MRVINVVTLDSGALDNIQSFGVFEEQLSQDVVDVAEKAFIEKAKELGFDDGSNSDEDLEIDPTEELLDNGYYENEETNKSVCISWSNI